MKNNAYQNSKLKHQLWEKKRRGVGDVIWRLDSAKKDYIENSLGFETEPYLYIIYTRKFCNIKELPPLLKNLHYANRQNKRTIVCKLNHREIKLLNEYGVSFKPYKYKIKLCG